MNKNHLIYLIVLMLGTSLVAMEKPEPELKRKLEDSSESDRPSKRIRLDESAGEKIDIWPMILAVLAGEGVEQALIDFYHAASQEPNIVDDAGYTPLMLAASYGHTSVAQNLVLQGAYYKVANGQDRNKTAVHYAAQNGHLDIVAALVWKAQHYDNVSIDDETTHGDTAVSLAYLNGHRDVALWLLSQNFTGHVWSPACQDYTTGATSLLDVAIDRLDVEFARALFAHGANFVEDIKLGTIGVALAATENFEHLYAMINCLIEHGANANMTTEDLGDELTSTLSFALENADGRDISDVLELLIRCGADTRVELAQGTLLSIALNTGDMHIRNIETLCRHVHVTQEDLELAERTQNRRIVVLVRSALRRTQVQQRKAEQLLKRRRKGA